MTDIATTTFFDSIARHNLERFHSECLAWLFNTEHQIANQVIHKFTSEPKVEFVYAFTEVQQLDLVLYYRVQGVGKAIIIENKVKSAEGSKKLTVQEKNSWASLFEDDHTFSQTEYYYLRHHAKKNIQEERLDKFLKRKVEGIWIYDPKSLAKTKNQEAKLPKGSENWILIQKTACCHVFLIPAKWDESIKEQACLTNYDIERYNEWSLKGFEENPWKTTSYLELLEAFKGVAKVSTGDNLVLVDAYLAHLKKMAHTYERELNFEFKNYSPTTFGAYEYFKVLAFALTTRSAKENLNLFPEVIARPGSSNSGEPILDIYFTKNISVSNEDKIYINNKVNSKEPEQFSVGIQLQGQKVKLFIAANDYENVKVIQPGIYATHFFNLLKGAFKKYNPSIIILGDRNFCQLEFESGIYSLNESLSKGKSFMNYYFHLVDYFDGGAPISFQELFDFLYLLSKEVSRALPKPM
jgi:hypothetical protein